MPHHSSKGFTLIEALVTITIITIVLTVIIYNQNKYNAQISLVNTAEEIAVTLAEAQAYGLSVKEFSPGTGEFRSGYGISAYSAASINQSSKSDAYILFADWAGGVNDSVYNGAFSCPTGSGQECLNKTILKNGLVFSQICSIRNNNTETCNVGRVDITFVRPEVEARFAFWNTSITNNINNNRIFPANVKGVRLRLLTPSGEMRSIRIYINGQVTVS